MLPIQLYRKGEFIVVKAFGKALRQGRGPEGVSFYFDEPSAATATFSVVPFGDNPFIRTKTGAVIIVYPAAGKEENTQE